jgi:hypothetical protein
MTQTVTATQEVTETIAIERFGGAVNTWNGDNVQPVQDATASSPTTGTIDITSSSAEFYVVDPSQPWQLEIITRAAGLVETEDVTRTIETSTTTNTLSVFSQ